MLVVFLKVVEKEGLEGSEGLGGLEGSEGLGGLEGSEGFALLFLQALLVLLPLLC